MFYILFFMDCINFDVFNIALKLLILITEVFWHLLKFCRSAWTQACMEAKRSPRAVRGEQKPRVAGEHSGGRRVGGRRWQERDPPARALGLGGYPRSTE